MKSVSEVYSEVGKAFVNAGLGFMLAAMIAWLFTREPVVGWVVAVGIIIGLAQLFFGAWLIQIAHQKDGEQAS